MNLIGLVDYQVSKHEVNQQIVREPARTLCHFIHSSIKIGHPLTPSSIHLFTTCLATSYLMILYLQPLRPEVATYPTIYMQIYTIFPALQ